MALNYYRSDGWVKTTQGPAIPGAQIYVCTQPANVTPPVTPPRTTPVPFVPNPQALIYSDDGLTPLAQPVITDGFGHYDFYILPGLYTVAIYYGGNLQQFYVDQSIGNVGTAGNPTVTFMTNGTPNFNQTLQNLVQGAGTVISTDNLGNTTIAMSGGGSGSTSNWFLSTQSILTSGPQQNDARFNDGISAGGGIVAVQVNLQVPITVKKVSINCTVLAAASYTLVAVYSADGTTKLLDIGSGGLDTSTTGVMTVTLVTPITLPAGSYLVAWSNTGGASQAKGVGVDTSSGPIDEWINLMNANAARYVRAGNILVSGAMPSGLGTLTTSTGGSRFDVPAFLFE